MRRVTSRQVAGNPGDSKTTGPDITKFLGIGAAYSQWLLKELREFVAGVRAVPEMKREAPRVLFSWRKNSTILPT